MNDISFLHKDLQKIVSRFIELSQEKGVKVDVSVTYRTEAEQDYYYAQGRLVPGDVITLRNHKNNYHCWGLAFDIEPLTDEEYEIIYPIAKSLGLEWAGHRKEFPNKMHFEYPIISLKELRLTYKNYTAFRQSWESNYTGSKYTSSITEGQMRAASMNTKLIESIQMACNSDGFRDKKKQILTITKQLDYPTLEALSNINLVKDKKYSIVKKVQIMLTKAGFSIVTTGKYDAQTTLCVNRFRIFNGLEPNGKIDKDFIIVLLSKI